MIAVHLSDTHGTFPDLPKEASIVLHTGDFCPNFIRNGRFDDEGEDQREWLHRKEHTIKKWLGRRTMLVVQGNHDFTTIRVPGVVDITNRKVKLAGDKIFYGFPWVPAFGPWNWCASPAEMAEHVKEIPIGVDVLMAHCPPFRMLDSCPGGFIGNKHLIEYLDQREVLPKWLLCGHVHESGGGVLHHYDMTIMNMATTMKVFEL